MARMSRAGWIKVIAACCATLAGGLAAQADLVVVQKVDGGGQSGEQTIRVKGDKARCDIGTSHSLLVDRKTGESTTLSHGQKGYLTVSSETARAKMEQMQKKHGSTETPKLTPTGKKDKIGDRACEIFTADVGALKLSYWIAADYPNYLALLAQLDVLESGPLSAAGSNLTPRFKDFPGMWMKIVMEMGDQKITVTLVSAKEEPVDAKIFEIPKDYRELPSLPPPKP